MKETLKLFLNELTQAMPKYKEYLKYRIARLIVSLEEDRESTINKYTDSELFDDPSKFSEKLGSVIENVMKATELSEKLSFKQALSCIDYLDNNMIEMLLKDLKTAFEEKKEYRNIKVTEKDYNTFLEIYNKYYTKVKEFSMFEDFRLDEDDEILNFLDEFTLEDL